MPGTAESTASTGEAEVSGAGDGRGAVDVLALLEPLGFHLERVSGLHRIYRHPEVPRPFALQTDGGKARPYQVRQLLGFLDRYDLPGVGRVAKDGKRGRSRDSTGLPEGNEP